MCALSSPVPKQRLNWAGCSSRPGIALIPCQVRALPKWFGPRAACKRGAKSAVAIVSQVAARAHRPDCSRKASSGGRVTVAESARAALTQARCAVWKLKTIRSGVLTYLKAVLGFWQAGRGGWCVCMSPRAGCTLHSGAQARQAPSCHTYIVTSIQRADFMCCCFGSSVTDSEPCRLWQDARPQWPQPSAPSWRQGAHSSDRSHITLRSTFFAFQRRRNRRGC